MIQGLTSAQASAAMRLHGPNEIPARRRWAMVREAAALATSPLMLVLFFAVAVSAWLGQWTSASTIFAMAAMGIALQFAQTYRSSAALERLRALESPMASVMRDGEWKRVEFREVVPDDVVRIEAGDGVPADAVVIEAWHLYLEQAALTGESLPAEAAVGAAIFRGSSVVSGACTARVTATGSRTRYGEIAAHLRSRRPLTEFERGIARFSGLILRLAVLLTLFLFSACALAGRPITDSLLFAIAIAVGLTPEFLPVISTVILGRGAVRMAANKAIVKNLASIQNFGGIDILCSDKTGTLTTGAMELRDSLNASGETDAEPARLARINSRLHTGLANPLDDAILRAPGSDEPCEKLAEIPFDFDRRRMSVVVKFGGTDRIITKGAPESVLAVCRLDTDTRAACDEALRKMRQQGLRVLAVATGERAVEEDLTLSGFLTFADPPRADAGRAIASLRADGVAVKILTGDDPAVAIHVCRAVGIDPGEPLDGVRLACMTDTALGAAAERTTVFARVSPADKTRVVRALKARGHVVGFLGDGINDAPSLHEADVGISVSSAVDIAKEAADVILQESGLGVLHRGILEGRRAYGNVMKYLLMGASSNLGNMLSMAAASLLLPFLPMLPMQILLNNFLYDAAQVPIATDRVEPALLRKPRRWDIGLVRSFMLWIGPVSTAFDFLTFWVLLRLFPSDEAAFHTGWFVESLATQTLVLFVIRTPGNPLRSRPSGALAAAIAAVVLCGAALPYTPFAHALGFVPLPPVYFAFLFGAVPLYLVMVEAMKRRLWRRAAPRHHERTV